MKNSSGSSTVEPGLKACEYRERTRSKSMWFDSTLGGLLLLLVACGSDHSPDAAKKVVSLDLLGIMHEDFPCEKYLTELEDATEINIGYLAGKTFGNQRRCLETFLQDPRTADIRVHICNGPCIRNERCHRTECSFGLQQSDGTIDLPRFESFVADELFSLPTSRRYWVSPVLEHELSPEVFGLVASTTLRLASQYGLQVEIVDNPLYPRESSYLLEVHNEFDPVQMPYLYSTDGYMFDPRVLLSLNQEALIAFEWRPEFNGLCTDGSPWVSPLERRCW